MKPRIALVEDEPSIAESIVYALEQEGYAVEWHSAGQAALDAVEQAAPALMILDVGLPDISGFDVCRQLRAKHGFPVIFLTARDSEIDRVVGLEIGGDDYVAKPFSPRELVARVRARLRTHQPVASASGELQIDLDQQCARWDGQVLPLTRYELRLLAALHAQPGRVFSRDQLLNAAWDDPTGVFDRTVDTHIKTLRQKLRDVDRKLDVIKTHRGVGYAYQPPEA